ncbi:MAG TPA: hypothetical protein VFY25_14915 [Anaerolineales bacterium]|nr:hypothetical protein [Anaerolineales bacterium]
MESISRLSLARYGEKVCELYILPFLIRHVEPVREQGVASSRLPEVNPVVTDYELNETLRKYQFVDYLFKYALIGSFVIIPYSLARLFALFSPLIGDQDEVRTVVMVVSGLAFLIFWLGAYLRMKSRREEWQKLKDMEISLEKIEYFAKSTSSAIIAQLLVDIERIRETQKQEADKAKKYSGIQSDVLKAFVELNDANERRKQGKEFGKQLFFIAIGYAIGKGFDSLLGLLPDNPNR